LNSLFWVCYKIPFWPFLVNRGGRAVFLPLALRLRPAETSFLRRETRPSMAGSSTAPASMLLRFAFLRRCVIASDFLVFSRRCLESLEISIAEGANSEIEAIPLLPRRCQVAWLVAATATAWIGSRREL